jgi:hypothetical protein
VEKKRASPHSIYAEKITYPKYSVCRACSDLPDFNSRMRKKFKDLGIKYDD